MYKITLWRLRRQKWTEDNEAETEAEYECVDRDSIIAKVNELLPELGGDFDKWIEIEELS